MNFNYLILTPLIDGNVDLWFYLQEITMKINFTNYVIIFVFTLLFVLTVYWQTTGLVFPKDTDYDGGLPVWNYLAQTVINSDKFVLHNCAQDRA